MTRHRTMLDTLILGGLALLALLGQGAGVARAERPALITVLPVDAIPAILQPTFVPASQARVAPEAAMIGVVLQGDARAYAAWLLHAHEIVNDVVGGEPLATTW